MAEAQRTTDKPAAIAAYRTALKADPTLFSTWNNLGVLLFQEGDRGAAREAFEKAVELRPGYATGWFNLGVAGSDASDPAGFLKAQGAMGKATRLDGRFRDADRAPAFDEEVYDSGLDLSRPIPDDWKLVKTSRSRPSLIGLGLLLLVLFRIGWALGSDWVVGRGLERAIGGGLRTHPRVRRAFEARPSALWTSRQLAALLFLSGSSGRGETGFLLVLLSALLAAHALAPRLLSPGTPLRQASFVPASVIAVLLALPGLGFGAAGPIAEDANALGVAVRTAGVVVLGVVTVVLGVVAWATAVRCPKRAPQPRWCSRRPRSSRWRPWTARG